MMKKFTLLFIIAFLFSSMVAFGQVGTTIEYQDDLTRPVGVPLILTYNGLVNGKHSYTETGDDITVFWSGSRWEITCCGGGVLIAHSDAMTVGLNPPTGSSNAPDPLWILDDPASMFVIVEGSGTTSVLPVELISFTAVKKVQGLELQWQTASELNNEKFEIEMSQDGRSFKKIGEVKGYGTTQTQVDYDFQIEEPPVGVSYYRLKQMDFDGQFEYSDIVSATFEDKGVVGSIYPNPSRTGLVNLDLIAEESKMIPIAIFNASGQLVLDQFRQLEQGNNQLNFNFSSLTAGIYIVRIGNEQVPIQRKLIIN